MIWLTMPEAEAVAAMAATSAGGSSDCDGGRGGASMAGSSRRSKQIVEETRNENPLIVHTALPRSSGGFLLTVVNSCQPFVVIQALRFR